MNTATGNSGIKEHWSKGSRTACNRKISTNKLETEAFKNVVLNYPEMCCSKCLSVFNNTK